MTTAATPDSPPPATIIPFPGRASSVPPAGPLRDRAPLVPPAPSPEQDRLRIALASLNAALADQREAMKAWRGAMGDLKASTAALEESLQRYRGNLRTLGNRVNALGDQARALEAWADQAVAKQGAAVPSPVKPD